MEEAGRVTGSSSSPGAGGRSVDASGDMSRGEKTAWSLKRRGVQQTERPRQRPDAGLWS